jgi:Arc/MetJ-type ribon-helix-helix transcriptional regulator
MKPDYIMRFVECERGNVWYTYGMKKTTIYLPDELKKRIEKVARSTGKAEAEVIREAISAATRDAGAPAPRIPLMERGLGDPTIAENVDALLESFGR